MSVWTDRHVGNLQLQLGAVIKRVKESQPTYAAAFEKRIREDLIPATAAIVTKFDSIRTSGRYSPGGELDERRLTAHSYVSDTLAKFTTATITKLQSEREKQRAALHKPKAPSSDPGLALVNELRAQEWRTMLRGLDKLALQTLLRTTDNADLLDVLDAAPPTHPIIDAALISEARTRIAEANHPELGELAQLEQAYSFALGAARQTVVEASGLTELEINTPPTPQPVGR